MTPYIDDVRSARVRFEAALAVSDSEDARAAWRGYHQMLAGVSDSDEIWNARRLLDEAIADSDDEQLIDAKRRYLLAIRGARRAS